MLHGADISAWQASIPRGMDFVIVKATEGSSYVNRKFRTWWSELADRGVLRGAYHFARPAADPAAQADHFLATAGPLLQPGDLLALDHEESDGRSPSHCAAWARTWLNRVEAQTGIRPLVYTYVSFARSGHCAGLGSWPLWIANPSRPPGNPYVPAPWTSWVIHQHDTTPIDKNVFNGDAAAWRALAEGEDDMARVVSIGGDGKQTIQPGKTAVVIWTKEWTDKHKLHADDGWTVAVVKDPYWFDATISLALAGLLPGEKADVTWTRYSPPGKDGDPWRWHDNAWTPIPCTADEQGRILLPSSAAEFGISKTRRPRLCITNHGGRPLRIESAMCKAKLFRY